MLNQIRNLSKHPVILIMMGMLIFVFVLFFGLPGQAGDQGANIYTQWNARVGSETLNVSDALLYARRRARNSNDLSPLKLRMNEMIEEELIDQAAAEMGWVSTYEQERAYIASYHNHDLVYFSDDLRRNKDINEAFIASLPAGVKAENLSAEQLINAYLAFVRKSFKAERAQEMISGWGLNTDQYIAAKGRELRVRGYLNFLKSGLKVSDREAREAFKRANESWRFDVLSVNASHVAPDATAPSDEQVADYLKNKAESIKAYYKGHIEDYSKTKLKFTQVSARYSGEEQRKVAEEKITQARARVLKGEDAEKVASELSTDDLTISAFVMSNKTRKNTSAELFEALFKMKASELTELKHAERPTFNFPGMAPQPKGGTFSFARLEEREEGEEKTLKNVEAEIAKVLIERDGRAARAENVAKQAHALIKRGKSVAEAATEASQEGAEKALEASVSSELKLDMFLEGNLEGIGRDATAGEMILKELLSAEGDTLLISAPIKVGDEWVVLSLKEHTTPDTADFETQKATLAQNSALVAQGRTFGPSWLQYSLLSPSPAPGMPREVFTALQGELMAAFSAGQEGFLDVALASPYFQKLVERNPAVARQIAAR